MKSQNSNDSSENLFVFVFQKRFWKKIKDIYFFFAFDIFFIF